MDDGNNLEKLLGPKTPGSGACSYWTKRRRILKSVNESLTLSSLANDPQEAGNSFNCYPFSSTDTFLTIPNWGEIGYVAPDCSSGFETEKSKPTAYTEDEHDDGSAESDRSYASSVSSDWVEEHHLLEQLSRWAMKFGVTLDALTDLLHILHPFHPDLPLTGHTVLSTPDTSNYEIKTIGDGHYHHFGVATTLKKLFVDGVFKSNPQCAAVIKLQVNVDGLPIYKSTNYQLWPILGMVVNTCIKVPFVIGIYGGSQKPTDVFKYMNDFVTECQTLEATGMALGDDVFAFQIHSIVCDAPARAFIRNTKGHNAYYGCDRCTQSGKWLNKMTYPDVSAPKRTDTDFRLKINEEYHVGDCPLAELSVNLVSVFPLDYMHLVCLGVMRRLILAWVKGPLNARLPSKSVCKISDKLIGLRCYLPSEFCRKPRSLHDIDRFKATEFRQILLYTGVFVFRDILPSEHYSHFMMLSCAMYCVLSPELCCNYCDYAEQLLTAFVAYCEKLYGSQFMVYNVHSLVHIADDVRNFGALDEVSCFPFENYLHRVKRSVRSSYLPFKQVLGRVTEMQRLKLSISVNKCEPQCRSEHYSGPVGVGYSKCRQYRSVVADRFKLSVGLCNRDSCILTSDHAIGIVKNVIMDDNSHVLLCVAMYTNICSLYTYPLSSADIDVYSASELQDFLTVLPLSSVRYKCVHYPLDESTFAVIPLLHTS